jgi:hypothetical protein
MIMKRLVIVAAACIALPAAAQAPGFVFHADLSGYQEVPSVASNARGTFDAVLGGDFQSIAYTLSFSGLSSPVQQAHIHFASPSVNGPIIIWLCGTAVLPGPAGTPPCPQAGTVSGVITSAQVLASPATQQVNAGDLGKMINGLRNGAAYANVHTAISPGGEIRGQIE